MKLLLNYLKYRLPIYAVAILFFAVFIVSFLLYRLPIEAVIYPTLLCIVFGGIISISDFKKIKNNHNILTKTNSITDAVESKFPATSSISENDYKRIISVITQEHGDFCTKTSKDFDDTVNYYTAWVHQIKTPIASMRLKIKNEDTEFSRRLYGDLHRIEQYVEMVLTFLRLNSESSDYLIREYSLDSIIKQSVKKFSYDFIDKKLALVYEPTEETVLTDAKWLSFVIEQVLSNALKYTKQGKITFCVDKNKKLTISDTGIGIDASDMPRIFQKGYTGISGRTDKNSSGIGLYLCKRICDNLGHEISASSVADKGTSITIDLAKQKIKFE